MRSPPRVLSALTALLVCAASLFILYACQDTPEVVGPSAATTTIKYKLTIYGAGTGNGVVTSVPAGINCTITAGTAATTGCTALYDNGTTVVLTATPAAGHSFANWTRYCSGTGTCTVPMTTARSVGARFLKGPFWIKVVGGGTGTGSGTVKSQTGLTPAINCVITNGSGGSNCGASYPAYTELTLTATPAAGNTFVGWSPICTSAGTGPCTYTVTQWKTITATFASTATSYPLTISGLGSGSGTVTSQSGLSPAIDCTITAGVAGSTGCSASYPSATVVTLTATPNGGHVFTGWQGACSGTGTCSITMSQTRSVTAGFSTSGTSIESTAGRWEPLITTPVIALHLHLLTSGKVLMWGHNGEGQLWDPGNPTGGFTQITNPFELFCSGSTYLADGRLLTAGGHISNDHGLPSAAIFDHTTNTWSLTGSMARGRWYPTVTTLPNGEILVMAGQDENGLVVTIPEIWNGSTWRQLTSANLSLPYYPRNFVAPNGRVFMAGEVQTTRYLNTGGTGSWSTVASRNFATRDYGSAVMYAPGKIIYIGGGNTPTRTAEVIDLNQASPSWRTVASMAFARRQMNATLLADGKVMVTHGTSGTGFNNAVGAVRDAELWNPATETWSTLAAESAVRIYHSTALLLPDARVLSTGSGDGAGSTNEFSLQIFTPPYLFNNDGSLAARPLITSAPGSLSYGQSFQVESPSASSVTTGKLIRLSSVTHADNMSQVIYPLTFSRSGTTLTATAPPSANIAPPGPYMLFLLNSNGVPSVGKILLID